MKVLDVWQKRLIMMKYIIREENAMGRDVTEISALEKQAEKAAADQANMMRLAKDISECLNLWKDSIKGRKHPKKTDNAVKKFVTLEDEELVVTKSPYISRTSLMRYFGFLKAENEIKASTLDILAKYVGFASWNELVNAGEENAKYELLNKCSLQHLYGKSSIAAGEMPLIKNFLLMKFLKSDYVQEGNYVYITYDDNREFVFKKLRAENRFMVEKSGSKVLTKGMSISILAFYLDSHIQGIDVRRGGKDICTYYRSRGLVKRIVVKDEFVG